MLAAFQKNLQAGFLILLCTITSLPAQSTTRTSCWDYGFSVSCTSRTSPNWGQSLAQAFAAAADEQRQREATERQERLIADQQRLIAITIAEKNIRDAEDRERIEALARLYWARAQEVIEDAADSLNLDKAGRNAFLKDAQGTLKDLFLANPQASSMEITDNIRPNLGRVRRLISAWDNAVINWVSENRTFLGSLSKAEQSTFIEHTFSSRSSYIENLGNQAEAENTARKWLQDEKDSLIKAREVARSERLAAEASAVAARIRATRLQELSARIEQLSEYRNLEVKERTRVRKLLELQIDETLQQPATLSLSRLREWIGTARAQLIAIEEVCWRIIQAEDSPQQNATCKKELAADSTVRAFHRYEALVANQLAESQRVSVCFNQPTSCSDSDIPDSLKASFSHRRNLVHHPALTRIPVEWEKSLTGPDTTIEWKRSIIGSPRISVSRRKIFVDSTQSEKIQVTWNFVFGGPASDRYDAETVEALFDSETLALVSYKEATANKTWFMLLPVKDDKKCITYVRNESTWTTNSAAFEIANSAGTAIPPAVLRILAHLDWPSESAVTHQWLGAHSRTVSSATTVQWFDQAGKAYAPVVRDENGLVRVRGPIFSAPPTVFGTFRQEQSKSQFDQWYAQPNSGCNWN
jgi:hypothetical protein